MKRKKGEKEERGRNESIGLLNEKRRDKKCSVPVCATLRSSFFKNVSLPFLFNVQIT